ncbi:MAG: DUF3473 domain-containing protein [Magnetococcales bacterium]|nr:DUF3473 domain-containing protein [Magnetococcales bacterium]
MVATAATAVTVATAATALGKKIPKKAGSSVCSGCRSDTLPVTNAFTIDVEDYFHVALFEKHISRNQWDAMEYRVEGNTDTLLELLDRQNVHATFFILGWVAERFPNLVRRIATQGHEVASHGMYHVRVTEQNPDDFLQDILASKHLLEDLSGQPVRGYRASTYSIGRHNVWAFELLEKAGYGYSSSVYPIRHDLYGWPKAPRFPFYPRKKEASDSTLLEVPITTLEWFGMRLPCGGGGYFRLYPLAFSLWALRQLNQNEGQSAVFYCHPWELDPDQPRISGLPGRVRLRHYLNLHKTANRLHRLLASFQWDRLDRIFLPPSSERVSPLS